MTPVCTLDASAALSLLVKGQATVASRAFFAGTDRVWCAPTLLRLEIRNAIHRLERRGALEIGAADGRLRLLETLVRFVDHDEVVWLDAVVRRARAASLSVYDATYLETSRRAGASLATRDGALLRAAGEADVATFDLR